MSFRAHNIELPGVPVLLAPTQAVAYLAKQRKSPRAIHKLLKGQMTYGAVRCAMMRARKDDPTIPLWTGGFPKVRGAA